MKITLWTNHNGFNFNIDSDVVGSGTFEYLEVTSDGDEITDLTIEITIDESIQNGIDYDLTQQEIQEIEIEVKRLILEEPMKHDAHHFLSEQDSLRMNYYEEIQRQYNEDRL